MEWSFINYFKESEFHGDADNLDVNVILGLDSLRSQLKERIHVSNVKGAVARYGGSQTSQHYVGVDSFSIVRKSTAVDVFIEGIPFLNAIGIIKAELFTGIGIYVNTTGMDGEPWLMFHLDQRKDRSVTDPLVWIANKVYDSTKKKWVTKYHYPQRDASLWSLLQKPIFFKEREM